MDNYIEQIHSKQGWIESLRIKALKNNTFTDYFKECRAQLEPIIFDALREMYGSDLKTFWNRTTIPYKSNKAIVFVERRCHPNLEFCIHNAVYFAKGYSLHIFCSEENREFVKTICATHIENIHIHVIFKNGATPEEGRAEYNFLLKQEEFWNNFEEEYVLMTETDSYLFKKIPESIYKYDYAASKWYWLPNNAGGGGLSHRKISFMKEICRIKSLQEEEFQDTFASSGVNLVGAIIPEDNQYFSESVFSIRSVGTHQWWTFPCLVNDDTNKRCIEYYLTLHV